MKQLVNDDTCSLYQLDKSESKAAHCFIASTSETRQICNDPFVVGVNYTQALSRACAASLIALRDSEHIYIRETETVVLHILRGGLNFGLRDSLHSAFGWNTHNSTFLSAQRERQASDPEKWQIVEDTYRKVYLPPIADILCGDVVATGTSLEFAFDRVLDCAKEQNSQIRSILFFTIGSYLSEDILAKIDEKCKKAFPDYKGSTLIYLEGRFNLASPTSKLSVKLTGTDLLRSDSVLAPEFIASQYENPSYPLERCTIYDAGSRAFYLPEYLEDVKEYWTQTLGLAKQGMSFEDLLKERFPEIDYRRFGEVNLESLCLKQIEKVCSF